MIQKFLRYQFVHVSKVKAGHFSNRGDFDAIISGSYSDLYGGKGVYSYQLYVLEEGKVIDCRSWYEEWQLESLPKQSTRKAVHLIEAYNFKE